ncbi:MAG: hypothetical protein ACR2QU_01265 [Gammaproteobacteria bacterium]
MMFKKRGPGALRPARMVLLVGLVSVVVAGCARPVVMENCDYQSAFLAEDNKAESFRLYVLTAPPMWSVGDPSIDIALDSSNSESVHYRLELEQLEANERMRTYYGDKKVDLWRRYRLASGSHDRYRQLLADVASESSEFRRLDVSTSVSRLPGKTVREIRIASADAHVDEVICRL